MRLTTRRSAALSGLRVLVVDDVADIRMLMREMLREDGAEVLEAGTVGEAVQVLRACAVDVVLTDLGLPDAPGEMVITHIRAALDGRTAVAVLSGAGPDVLGRALALGAERAFAKPLDWEAIVAYLAGRAAA